MNFFQKTIQKHQMSSFVIITFGITWIGSSIYFIFFHNKQNEIPSLFGLLSSFIWYYGPCLAAVIVTRITKGNVGIRNLMKRIIMWRVKWYWYLFIVLYPFALHFSIVALNYLINGTPITFFEAAGVPQGNLILILLGLILLQIFQRGIGEETGWRGFVLPELQIKNSAIKSSLILGLIWAAWHFHPANFNALISEAGIFIFFNILLTTFLFTWLYNHTNGSLLMAILFHMSLNMMEFVIPIGFTEANLTLRFLQIGIILLSVVVLYAFDHKNQMEDFPGN